MKTALIVEGINDNLKLLAIALRRAEYFVLAAGFNGYIGKPINPIDIVDQIHEIIRKSGQT